MAYGFNLGQIEGLDSSVKTITLTIANATDSNTYTLTYTEDRGGDFVENYWCDAPNTIRLYNGGDEFQLHMLTFTESDVGDTYNVTLSTSAVEENFKSAVETVLVDNGLISGPETLFDGTITITAEDTQGVEIPFDMDVSGYPLEKWTVTVNGLEIPYQADFDAFRVVDDNIGYGVFDNDGVYTLQVINLQDESHPPLPGDYQVKIVGITESKTDSDNTIYIDARNDVATMSVDPTILYDALNTDGGAIPRVVVRGGGGAHEITHMRTPDRPANTIILNECSFGVATIEAGSTANEFFFTFNGYRFTKGNKIGTVETVHGTIPFTPIS